ncbi:hypothetical protein AJ78_03824 [Emergomyces pasteurianus Ep9510]|uniref:Alkaline phosphatase n=1 Tax=Emergomyces pasteurianus Ep9510 TaxID=1447872 RepID=A0A1J9Q6T6_9EURO|nr:hypothetical protein AJ78_03824 [Emergomyces pasteurianus Ep9510]
MAFLNLALVVFSLGSIASASFYSNLNYRSPSYNHPHLGIDINKVHKRNIQSAAFKPEDLKFTHGVASGDPYPNSVILWTRIAPTSESSNSDLPVSGTAPLYDHDNAKYVAVSTAPICVEYKVAKVSEMQEVVNEGEVWTSSDVDYTVKVEATGLDPFTTYYYQFNVCKSDIFSPVGRTKTIPMKGDKVKTDIKLAVFSCANYPMGFFNAFGNSARKDNVDYVINTGDYIYEYKEGTYGWGWSIGRIPKPSDHDTKSLYDYRLRYGTHRTDPDLLYAHQIYPWITVWDDHDVADNLWKSGSSSMNNTEQSFIESGGLSFDQVKANAVRAAFEWLPLRQVDMDDGLRVWRNFEMGDLFSLIMLDTRVYDRSITDLYSNMDYVAMLRDEQSRSLLGPRQEAWFYRQLQESAKRNVKWRVVGQQVLISEILYLDLEKFWKVKFNLDAWDGYRANRNRTLATIVDNEIDNTIILSGDTHNSYVADLVYLGHGDYDSASGSGAIGVEFGGAAVTSPGPLGENVTQLVAELQAGYLVEASPALQWQESFYRGYFEVTINYERVTASFFGIPDVRTKNGKEMKLASFEVLDGANKLTRNAKQEPVVGEAVAGALKHGEVHYGDGKVYDTEHPPG